MDVNERFCELMGYERDWLLGRRFQDITYPDDQDINAAALVQVNAGEIAHYRMQKRYIRSNGEILWSDLTVSKEVDEHGDIISLVSVVSDIRDFKRAEERMAFLMRELSHRSKNVLAVVLSILEQTQAEDVASFREALRMRLMGLAVSNDLLTDNGLVAPHLAGLVEKQMSAFVATDDPRVTVKVDHIPLGTDASRVLGMAIHELATNSCKYGALSSTSGRLLISTKVDKAAQDRVVISWEESGGPPVHPPERSGFGRKVIERMVARAVGAAVQLRFELTGVIWECRVRPDNLRL
jgi:PAS domain S-box-containing protein